MKQIYYNLILSEEQLTFLRSKKYKIDRMECFHKLIELTTIEPNKVQISKSKTITLQTGQFIISVKQLEKLWNIDRKTVPVLLAKMESMGILTTTTIEDTTVRILHPIFGWYVDGNVVTNPYFKMQGSTNKGEITSSDSSTVEDLDNNDSIEKANEKQADVVLENTDISPYSVNNVDEESVQPKQKIALFSEVCEPSNDDETNKENFHSLPFRCKEDPQLPEIKDDGADGENSSSAISSLTSNPKTDIPTTSNENIQNNHQRSHDSNSQRTQSNGYNNHQHNGVRGSNHGRQCSNLHNHRQQNNH